MKSITQFLSLVILFAGLFLAGCDENAVAPPSGGEATIQGRVTDDEGFGKTAGSIEGATVTAATVSANGTLRSVGGEAMTNAEGRYTLEVDETSKVMVLTATKGSFESRVLVAAEGDGTVRAMPMTTEAEAEAEVYLEVEAGNDQGDASEDATAADVVALVNTELALAIESGTTTAADVAAAVNAAARAEAEFLKESDAASDDDFDDVQENENGALLQLQVSLNGATSIEAEAQALRVFEEALVEATTDAGIALEAQARARQSARAALLKFFSETNGQARFALRQQAEILTSLATAYAVEAAFEAEGSTQARLDALAQSRATLVSDLRAATSAQLLADAMASYEADVRDALAAELNVDASLLATADTALSAARTLLDTSVSLALNAEAVAEAYTKFFTSAQTAAETTLSGNAKAGLGADVLTLLSAD